VHLNSFSYGYGRMFLSAEEWSTDKPWLECRKNRFGLEGKEVADGAGCTCYECWPKEIRSDTRVSKSLIFGPWEKGEETDKI